MESGGCARQPREEPQPEDLGPPAVPWDSCPSGVEGEPRTMAAVHDLEMESMNLNMGREMKEELEEEEKMREDGGGKDRAKSRKVHRIVSKWMLPEKARGTYLERANCFPPPVFIISISLAEVNGERGGQWGKWHRGVANKLGVRSRSREETGNV